MKSITGTMAILLCLVAFAAAQGIEERVQFDGLPDLAAGKFYTTIVYNDPMTQDDVKLHSFMHGNASMKLLREQTVWNEYTTSRSIIKTTAWKNFLGDKYPALLVQGPSNEDGGANVVFFANGSQLLDLLNRLPDLVQEGVVKYTQAKTQQPCPPRGPCPFPVLPRVPLPRPAPYPSPQPQPAVPTVPTTPPPAIVPITPTIVPTKPKEPEPKDGLPIWALALPVVGGLAGAARSTFKK